MPYQLGIDLGTTYSAAAVAEPGNAEIFQLGTSIASIPSVVLLRDDGMVLTGEAAQRRSMFESGRTAREFKRRLGDPTPFLLGGTPYGVEALTGHLLASIVEKVVAERGEQPGAVVLAHPAAYGPYKLGFLEDAARLAGVGTVLFVPEPVAAAVYYAHSERVADGELVAVYDFGGGTLDLAVVRRVADGFEVVGTPEGMERFGGVDLDAAVFGHVDEALGGLIRQSDPEDEAALAAVFALRTSCREAKEALSADTDVTVPVMLPNLHTEVRLTRAEFEDMIRPRLRETMRALERTVRSAGATFDDLSRVLLVGGASRIPLVAEMVHEATSRPVAVDAHPKHAVALGAALAPVEVSMPPTKPVIVEAPDREPEPPPGEPEPTVAEVVAATAASTGLGSAEEAELSDSVSLPEGAEEARHHGRDVSPSPIGPDESDEAVGGEELSEYDAAPAESSTRPRRLYAALGVAAALIVVVGGFLLLRDGSGEGREVTPTSVGETVPQAEPTPGADPTTVARGSERVAAVYRVGYRSEAIDGEWGDWAIGGNAPPDSVASDYMPALGLYSSMDPGVRSQHFEMLQGSSVGMVFIAWRGSDSPDNELIPDVLDEAEARGLSVAFVLDIHEGGTPETLISDVAQLIGAYGDHPAVFRPSDPSPWTPEARMAVVVAGAEVLEQQDTLDIDSWRVGLDAIHEIDGGAIVLAVSRDSVWIEGAHFDGLAYGPLDDVEPLSFAWAADLPDGAWFVPVVSPGRSAEWEGQLSTAAPREGVARYDEMWTAATTTSREPNLVLILSFNEWSTGTQIEPIAQDAVRPDGSPYRDYSPAAPAEFLDFTRMVVERWAGS